MPANDAQPEWAMLAAWRELKKPMGDVTGYIWTRESNVYDKEKYSIKSQLDACREAARADGVEVAPEREFEVQFSGRDLWAIPEMTELRESVQRADGPKRIYCYSQDRLVRGEEGPEIFWLLFELRRAGAEVFILKNPVDLKNIAGQIMTLVAGHEAAGEIEKIKDRTMRGRRKRIQEGKLWGCGRDKYGYRRNYERGAAEIVEEQADVVRRIYREIGNSKGMMRIARDLNADGIPSALTARGERQAAWRHSTIRRIARDPAYKGKIYSGRWDAGGEVKPESEWQPMADDLFPAIVSAEEWERAQKRLETNRGEAARNEKLPALLRGLIWCAQCGLRMYPLRYRKRERGAEVVYIYYRCSSRMAKQHITTERGCDAGHVRADHVEADVWEEIAGLILDPERIIKAREIAGNNNVISRLGVRRAALLKALARKEAEAQRQVRNLRNSDERVAKLIESDLLEIAAERAKLEAELSTLDSERQTREAARLSAEQIKKFCEQYGEMAADDAPFHVKRKIIEAFDVRVMADGKDWEIRHRFL